MRFALLIIAITVLSACSKEDEGPVDGQGNIQQPVETSFTPCENGLAGEYPCKGYDLLGHMAVADFNAQEANDIWGWTDASTGKEYALMGLDNGTAFIDITDTESLVYLGKLPTATVASPWRDIKVMGNFAYIVAEASGHGVQVFDLTKLRDTGGIPKVFEADGRYTGIGNAHNIVINENSGFAYPVGTDRNDAFNGGVHFLDLTTPTEPLAAGGWGTNGYTHDAQVVTYNGPDTDYSGAELFVGANETQIVLVDITDKGNPVEIATLPYPNIGYTHQGWFTEDQRYFILGDELDEINSGFRSRTLIFDMSDLDNPVLHDTYLGPTSAIDHNGYVMGDEFFLANYTAGVRVLDISDVDARNISEVGFFDTYPLDDETKFDGVWSVYPYFESGKIVVSDISNGFFVIKKSE
ncbi:choice-of-anchor B family protein [Maribacter aurantiacus]|uniref:Choice-of-anchor B family protein n=1 Tax=Maribacter aurantiacus TaxID=1882343 RepID=A0A5R8MA24_9FLAO|nr:choice-of-anchor B family protein [Maribacter aurantiacus]TLF46396.1 choice-of-anchor B family protein [Maribacter aurantiacus]